VAARVRRSLTVLAAALAAGSAGCGGGGADGGDSDSDGAAGRSDRLVDLRADPPLINSFAVDPADESFLLTTNRGFFRIAADGGKVERVRGTVRAGGGSSTVGTFLEIDALGPGRLLGSGHPDDAKKVPEFLGLMRSGDGGRTWDVVSRLGDADLHQITPLHDRLYAFDAVLGAILVSEDDGTTWTEHFTPRQLVLDFVVDPEDPAHLVASTEGQLYTSKDTGDKWRPGDQGRSPRLDWPVRDALMRADADGLFQVSGDGGQTWERRGRIDGEPYKIRAVDGERAFVALSDGTILETTDGGRSFEARFRP
jgi:hypothetical protein